ncbi:YciE/YciF ferroxidase family protein [Flavitalea flava]
MKNLENPAPLVSLFLAGIRDLYWTENYLVRALPQLSKASTSDKLKRSFDHHLQETIEQVKRLEKIFDFLGQEKTASKSETMEELSQESKAVIQDTLAGSSSRDMGIIMASEKVELYEVVTYNGMLLLARKIGRHDIASLLAETLAEELRAASTLEEIAQHEIKGSIV